MIISFLRSSAQQVEVPLTAGSDWQKNGLVIHVTDYLNHPKMKWPSTMLSYRVDLSAQTISANQIQLFDGSGKAIPFQLSGVEEQNGLVKRATLHFMSGLSAGEDHIFRLSSQKGKTGVAETEVSNVTVKKSDQFIELGNGIIRLQIPNTGNAFVPPVLKLGDAKEWYGKGEFTPGSIPENLTVTEVSKGFVFAEYLLKYRFKGNKSLNATIRLVSGMQFFELEEDMKGFNASDSVSWQVIWDQLKPDFRFCPNRPGTPVDPKKKGFDNFSWEPIGGSNGDPSAGKHPLMPVDQRNRAGGRLPFQIVPYDNWLSWWNLPTATFWDQSKNKSIGIFIKDLEKWDDGEYALWGSGQNLSIYFNWVNQQLTWTLPIVKGTRSTGICMYPHQKDIDLVSETDVPLLHTDYLRRWYGWISLDKVKNWTLDYNAEENTGPLFFKSESGKPDQDIALLETTLANKLANISENSERNHGPTPVGSRDFNEKIVPLWYANYKFIPDDKVRNMRAAFLFMTYVFMDESLMPMKTMLSGHPNFLADIKAVPGMAAAMFPNHPDARIFGDHLEKSVALNLRYHIRPPVSAWNATGGRYTENLGTYTWAFLKPTLRSTYLLHHHFDGRNRILQPNISLFAGWLLNSLTSPLSSKDGKRANPPQGAHAHGLTPSNLMRMLGQEMYYYDPILAEHLLFVTSPDDNGFEYKIGRTDPWANILQSEWTNNKGTNPHLRSAKYTGYGFILRKNFGRANETYVHLQQIDDGPNYRWGRAGKGGNGVIYYYANGRRYSHNGVEDVGDGPFGDVERSTNFGVKKPGGYRSLGPYQSVGRSDLTEPLFDFEQAQFAQINGSSEVRPDYLSRSVLQSGDDYIVVFDELKDENTEGRFSWFVGKEDAFPNIIQLVPGAKGVDSGIKPSKSNYHNDQNELTTKGLYFDGKGSFLTLVTHKNDVSAQKTEFGCIVKNGKLATDYVFRSSAEKVFLKSGIVFRGKAGIVQENLQTRTYSASLFQGKEIGIPGLLIELNHEGKNGISLKSFSGGYSGSIQINQAVKVSFTLTKKSLKPLIFYLNGKRLQTKSNSLISIELVPGHYNWQWNFTGLIPEATEILATVLERNGCEVEWRKSEGATVYQVEISKDNGTSWEPFESEIQDTKITLKDLVSGSKLHVRVLAKGSGGWSIPSADYPVYVTNQPPHAPEGLLAVAKHGKVEIGWGKILGAGTYKLYRNEKKEGNQNAQIIYSGKDRKFTDMVPDSNRIYEYQVIAENGNGISEKSTVSDTDPARLINWYPKPGETFRRDTRNHENGYDEYNPFIEETMPVLEYPLVQKK